MGVAMICAHPNIGAHRSGLNFHDTMSISSKSNFIPFLFSFHGRGREDRRCLSFGSKEIFFSFISRNKVIQSIEEKIFGLH
jgi:hypothetical protein